MLQFGATLCAPAMRHTSRSSRRFIALLSNTSSMVNSDTVLASTKENKALPESNEIPINAGPDKKQLHGELNAEQIRFNELKESLQSNVNANVAIIDKIKSAQSLNDILGVVTIPGISNDTSIKIMSAVSKWINSGNATLYNTETNKKLIGVQGIVDKSQNVVIQLTNEDFRKYAKLSTSALVTEVYKLTKTKNRNLPLIRFLLKSITVVSGTLCPAQCASLLYSMCVLSYLDEDLCKKICSNLAEQIENNVINLRIISIMRSFSTLRYKNEHLLDLLCGVIYNSRNSWTNQDLLGILKTFAALNYISKNESPVFEDMLLPLKREQITKPKDWLDFVWSLTVLEKAQPKHYSSVLNNDFMQELSSLSSSQNTITNLKLCNINAAARFATESYDGPYLDEQSGRLTETLVQPKRKECLIKALQETLQTMLPSTTYAKFNVNTGMGFLIDAVYYVNSEFQPIIPPAENLHSKSIYRIAMMTYDYSDYYINTTELVGLAVLQKRLLAAKGYEIIGVSYTNFGLEDKLEKRVAYLAGRIKSLQEELTS